MDFHIYFFYAMHTYTMPYDNVILVLLVILLLIIIALTKSFQTNVGKTGSAERNKTAEYHIYHTLTYPAASTFVEWLLPKLKQLQIPYKNPDTGGDYYKIFIGKSDAIKIDWKHLDIVEIKAFSKALEPYGYKIECWYDPKVSNHKVILAKLSEKIPKSNNFVKSPWKTKFG